MPAFIFGVLLGPVTTNLINVRRWTNGGNGEDVGAIAYVRLSMTSPDWATILIIAGIVTSRSWHSNDQSNYLVGIIHFEKLKEDDWWKKNGVSLILTAEPIIESLDVAKLKKRSLELAGFAGKYSLAWLFCGWFNFWSQRCREGNLFFNKINPVPKFNDLFSKTFFGSIQVARL